MDLEKWFTETLASDKDTPESRLETMVLELTEKICDRMEEKGLTRKEFAERLGVSPAAVTKILRD